MYTESRAGDRGGDIATAQHGHAGAGQRAARLGIGGDAASITAAISLTTFGTGKFLGPPFVVILDQRAQ